MIFAGIEMPAQPFQSAPLLRGAIGYRAGITFASHCFNPRPSCEGRWKSNWPLLSAALFQSAPLLRGAIAMGFIEAIKDMFQSAPLLRGAIRHGGHSRTGGAFQSAPLLRGAINKINALSPN